MTRNIFEERERGYETDYFHKQDEKLLKKMRERAAFQEVAEALAEKLRVDDPELLRRVAELGLTRETGAAILLAPLVQVAWAEGKVSKPEREVVLRLARQRGIDPDSPAYSQLGEWLSIRPSDDFFETAVEVLKAGYAVLPPAERDERIKGVVQACHEVAEASAGLGRLLGLGDGVSRIEASMLDDITRTLRIRE